MSKKLSKSSWDILEVFYESILHLRIGDANIRLHDKIREFQILFEKSSSGPLK